MITLPAYSPSMLKTFVKCPAQFKARYIDRTTKFVQSEAAARGERLHALMEQFIRTGQMPEWTDDRSRYFARGFQESILNSLPFGWKYLPEVEYGMNTDGKGAEYRECNSMRCRIDAIGLNDGKPFGLIFDWKTGRKYEADKLQLQLNAVVSAVNVGVSRFVVAFCYLDSGEVWSQDLTVTSDWVTRPEFKELSDAVTGLNAARISEAFPRQKNRFCRWCPVETCPHAG